MASDKVPSLVCAGDAGFGEGGHAGVAGQRCAQQQNGYSCARGFAEPHIEVEQRVETKFAQ
jgi:hypothetical protein